MPVKLRNTVTVGRLLLTPHSGQCLSARLRSRKLRNAFNLHVRTKRESRNTNAGARRGILREVLSKHRRSQSSFWEKPRRTYLSVDLIHRREIAREVGEVDVALEDRVTGDTSTLEDLGQVLDGSTLHRSR